MLDAVVLGTVTSLWMQHLFVLHITSSLVWAGSVPALYSFSKETLPGRRSQDRTLFVMSLQKGKPGQKWQRMFRGDPDGARCMQPVYNLTGQCAASCVSLCSQIVNLLH